jgi:hypothetical protein
LDLNKERKSFRKRKKPKERLGSMGSRKAHVEWLLWQKKTVSIRFWNAEAFQMTKENKKIKSKESPDRRDQGGVRKDW